MEFAKTETIRNLAAAFAGESQARGRYDFLASALRKAGQQELSKLITEIAGNELAHSKVFFDLIAKYAGKPVDNVAISAGYPFREGTVIERIRYAQRDETEEESVIYPKFADIADREGFGEIAEQFRKVASVERCHAAILGEAATQMEEDRLYRSDVAKVFRCSNCGFEIRAKEAFEKCPLCSHPRGFVELSVRKSD